MSRSHGLLRISERIFNTPQLMTQETFDQLTSYVIDRNTGTLSWQLDVDERLKSNPTDSEGKVLALNPLKANSFKRPDFSEVPEELRDQAYAEYLELIQYDPKTKLGVLNIEGTTVYRSTPFEAVCGMTSYQRLERTFKAQVAEGADKVLLYVDSGGGEAYGCFEVASAIRALADKSGVKLVAYVDGTSGSASYALTSVAHEVVSNPSSRVGSIGVVVSLMNDSKHLEKEGFERIFLYKGSNKVPFDEDGSFSKAFLDSVDEMLDKTYQNFTQHVAKYRPMTQQQVIDTQASVYSADKALELGLVDKLMTRDEFFGGYLFTGLRDVVQPHPYTVSLTDQQNEEQLNMDIKDITQQAEDSKVVVEGSENNPVVEPVDEPNAEATLSEFLVKLNIGDLSEVTAKLEKFQEDLAEKDRIIESLTTEKGIAEKALADFHADAIKKDRKEKLSSVLPTDRVDATLEFATKLSGEDFDTYFETLSATHIQSKEHLKELGVKGEDAEPAEDYQAIMSKAVDKINKANA